MAGEGWSLIGECGGVSGDSGGVLYRESNR